MLLHAGHPRDAITAGVDSINNYYEPLVLQEIVRVNERARQDADFLADLACIALNHLPPRYIRHNVDMTYFLSPIEMKEIYSKVEAAVKNAIDYVAQRETPQQSSEVGTATS